MRIINKIGNEELLNREKSIRIMAMYKEYECEACCYTVATNPKVW